MFERAAQSIEGQIRVTKLALEDRTGQEIQAEANIITLIAECAAYLMNRLEVGRDGKTAWEEVDVTECWNKTACDLVTVKW